MAAEPQKTGIKNADELITLATAYGLTVTVETTDRETITSYVVRLAIPVPVAYAGTELGRAIASDTLVMLWTKPNKGGRGRLEDATAWGTVSHRKVRTLRHVTAAVERMGHDSNKYARDTAPLPEDVVDALHAVFVDGRQVHPGIPAAHVRTIVKNRRFRGWTFHQDDENAICIENRRYAPVIVTGPTADDVVDAPHAVIDSHNDRHKDIPADDVRHMVTLRREAGQSSHQGEDGTITAAGIRFVPQPATRERKHVRIVNGGVANVIPTRDALDEMNTAQMEGKRDVREMSAARSSARIVYKDPARGTVELRPATAEEIADDVKTRRRAAGFAAKWWAEHHTEEPTDEALRAVFAHCVKPPRPELYPAIREAIAAEMPPAAAAPLFAALAAYEAVSDASLSESPRDLHTVACHLETLPLAAPASLHMELRAARDAAEEAWDALRTAEGLTSRTAARDKARAAIEQARAAVLAVEPRAGQMRGTYVPATAEEIRTAARAYLSVMGTPDERAAIETGTPSVRVNARSTLPTGSHIFVRITAGIDSPAGHIPAHPPVVVRFPRLDGRETPVANARKVFTPKRLRLEVPVSFHGDRRI